MTVLEAHVALSAAVGDVIDITNVTTQGMPDGARLTSTLRDACLTKALYDVYRGALNAVAPLPRSQGARLLQAMSPQTAVKITWTRANQIGTAQAILPNGFKYLFDFNTVNTGGTVNGAIRESWRPLYIYSLNLVQATGRYFPMPIKTAIEATALMNARNVQVADTFGLYLANGLTSFINNGNYGFPAGQVEVYDRRGDVGANDIIECTYMPIPAPINSTTQAGINRVIEIDSVRIGNLLTLAQTYAHINAQDIESIDRYLPTLLDLNKG